MRRLCLLLPALLFIVSCNESDVPFPYIPNLPTEYNLHDTFSEQMSGTVKMFTHEVYHEYYNGLVSQTTACFDSLGHCLEYYYRDREQCSRLHFEYDTLGRRVLEEAWQDTAGMPYDSLQRYRFVTTYSYSKNGRRCKTRLTDTDGKRHTFRLRYDKQGRLKRFIYPDGSRFSYEYDTVGHLVCRTWPDASTERYEYDNKGELRAMIDREGVYTWYMARPPALRTDSLGRVIEEVVGGSGADSSAPIMATYVYDDHGNWVRRTTAGVSTPTVLEVRSFKYYNE